MYTRNVYIVTITHVAIQNCAPVSGDCLVRRGNKYAFSNTPLLRPDDVPLPIQCASSPVVICFGDRIRRQSDGMLIDPLSTITWPTLQIGDTVLVNPCTHLITTWIKMVSG
jgi:hypothetical protein